MIALDTNVLVRYLTQDHPAQSALATGLIEQQLSAQNPGYVSGVVLAELHWVLSRLYAVDRSGFTDIARGLLSAQALRFDNVQAAWNALQAFEDGFDFVDALLTELGDDAGCTATVTFDPKLARHPKARLLVAA
jgi:predicted nucleic-acid-binding protein